MTQRGILFIHGFNSSPDTWRVSSSGQTLPYELTLKKYFLVNASIDDYSQPDQDLIRPLVTLIQESTISSWIIITHSLGIRPGLALARIKGLPIKALLAIDPTPLDEDYLKVMDERGWARNIISSHDLIPARVILKFHFNSSDEHLTRQINYYGRFVGSNLRSSIQVHPNKGHMIHQTDCAKIMDCIQQLLKLI